MAAPIPLPYFLNPFCELGTKDTDITEIDNTGSNAGLVNYQYGWTPNYELPSADPDVLPVPRQQMNQVLFDLTTAVKQLQTQGFSLWVSSASGGPSSYPINAQVAYNDGSGVKLYYSAIAANTSTPSVASSTWLVFSGNQLGVQPGTVVDFAGATAPAGYLLCDASQQSRTTYPLLYQAITQVQSCTTNSNTTLNVVSNLQFYVGMAVEGVGILSGTTLTVVDTLTPTVVTISQAATTSATANARFFNWGNGNGSTTFTLPPSSRRTFIGSGGTGGLTSGGVAGTVLGQSGGNESVVLTIAQLAAHDHPGSTVAVSTQPTSTSGSETTTRAGGTTSVTVASQGNNEAHNNMQPSIIMNKIIKT